MDITAQRINALRKEKGMTLEELGNRVGVGKSTVRKWETGDIANMKRDKIAKIAEALDTTPAYLLGWEKPSSTSQGSLDAELIYKFSRLTEAQKKAVMGFLDAFLNDSEEPKC